MMISHLVLAYALAALSPQSTIAWGNTTNHHELRLYPMDSIAQSLIKEHANGNSRPRLVLRAEVSKDAHMALNAEADGDEPHFIINVREPVQAVTPQTTISGFGEPIHAVGELESTILVADAEKEVGAVAVIAVDKTTGNVDGIVQKVGQKGIKFSQISGGKAIAFKAEEITPSDWEFNVEDSDYDTVAHDNSHDNDVIEQRLLAYNEEDHVQVVKEHDLVHAMSGLRGSSNAHVGETNLVQEDVGYSHQVNLYIQVDSKFVTDQGGKSATTNYVNSLVTAANTIFEPEIDTHLNVVGIEMTDKYDKSPSSKGVLLAMKTFRNENENKFEGVHLHYALVGRFSGGRAIIGWRAMCRRNGSIVGAGMAGGMRGNFKSVDNAMVTDLLRFTHELGHSFGSGHTHTCSRSKASYCPVIDTCPTECPSELPREGAATIMSYCSLKCGTEKPEPSLVAYTFGGRYKGLGDRALWQSYLKTPGIGNFNYRPMRVPAKMYSCVDSMSSQDDEYY